MTYTSGCFFTYVGSTETKAKAAGKISFENISDDENTEDEFVPETEEEEIDSEKEEEEGEEDMSLKRSAKKKTPKKNITPSVQASVDDVTTKLGDMMVFEDYSLEYKHPFMIKVYHLNNDEMCDVDFDIPTYPKECYIPEMADGGNTLELRTAIRKDFRDPIRVMKANKNKKGFNGNTTMAQSHKALCAKIDNDNGFQDIVFSPPQRVSLPFICEERIVCWEIQAAKNNLGELTDDLGGQQWCFTLIVTMRKLKEKRRTFGAFRLVDGDSDMEEGDGGDAGAGEIY